MKKCDQERKSAKHVDSPGVWRKFNALRKQACVCNTSV